MSLLQIDQLNLAIHGTPILRDVSFHLDAGQIVGLSANPARANP